MDHEKLETNVEEVRAAARTAVEYYLRATGSIGSDPSQPSSVPGKGGLCRLLNDPKFQALLRSALRDKAFFSQPPEEIFDLQGNLLFRDFVFALEPGRELRVRTGANRALGVLIVSVSLGEPLNRAQLIEAALAAASSAGAGQPIEPRRVVCYGYPRLGILLSAKRGGLAVVDLLDHQICPLQDATSDDGGMWQPLESQPSEAVEAAADRFDAEARALEDMPGPDEPRGRDIDLSEPPPGVPEHKIEVPLIVQRKQMFCALASSQMILQYHGINLAQDEIAQRMGDVEVIAMAGTPPLDQCKGLNEICESKGLVADIVFEKDVRSDWNQVLPRIVEEINNDRPIQHQLKRPLHVDVIGGFRGVAGSPDFMLWIFDPRQPDGDERLDRWNLVATNTNDLIFLRPKEQQ